MQSADLSNKLEELTRERDRIYEKLRTYPTPITACDDQFNYLLDERERISQELARIRASLR